METAILQVGDKASFSKTISESDVYHYIGLTGDFNPLHVDEHYAQKTIFKKRIVHGMIPAGLISTVIGTKLPGPGTIYITQNLEFKAPVYFNDTITAYVEVLSIEKEGKRVQLRTYCENQDGVLVLDGESLVSPPPMK